MNPIAPSLESQAEGTTLAQRLVLFPARPFSGAQDIAGNIEKNLAELREESERHAREAEDEAARLRALRLAEEESRILAVLAKTKPQRAAPPDGLRTPREAADKLGCSIKTLREHVASGALHYVSTGHGAKRQRRMFTDADLDQFIASKTRQDTLECLSTKTSARRSGHTTSGAAVIAFSAVPRPATSGKPKR